MPYRPACQAAAYDELHEKALPPRAIRNRLSLGEPTDTWIVTEPRGPVNARHQPADPGIRMLWNKPSRSPSAISLELRMVIVADGTPEAERRLERVLTADPATGVIRHADAGYELAIEVARAKGVDVPGLR